MARREVARPARTGACWAATARGMSASLTTACSRTRHSPLENEYFRLSPLVM